MDTRDYTVTIVLLPRLPTFPSPLSSLSHLTRCTFCAELSDSPVRFSLIVRYSLFDPRERNDTVFLLFFLPNSRRFSVASIRCSRMNSSSFGGFFRTAVPKQKREAKSTISNLSKTYFKRRSVHIECANRNARYVSETSKFIVNFILTRLGKKKFSSL